MKIICNNPFVEDVLLVCSVGKQVWLFLSFFLIFFFQNQGYSSYEIVLIQKKECIFFPCKYEEFVQVAYVVLDTFFN